MRRSAFIVAAALVAAGLAVGPSSAQFGKLKDKVKNKAAEKGEEQIDKAIDGQPQEAPPAEEAPADPAAGAGAGSEAQGAVSGMKPGEGVWVNYDFIPGDRILFFDDFSRSPVGDFPPRLEFVDGNMETAEWRGKRWLRSTSEANVEIPLPETLPERYTIEFLFYGPTSANTAEIYFDPDNMAGQDYLTFFWYLTSGVRRDGNNRAEIDVPEEYKAAPAQCRVMADGKYLKVYVNDKRVANIPNATYPRTNKLRLHLWGREEEPVLVTDIRIAEGGKKILYDTLLADGRVATQGIYFDSGSDRIRPESTPTLSEIGRMLQEHADLRLLIEGHTDDVGDDASNLALSEKRANAVRNLLADTYKIEAGRLEAKGFGESKPVASNATDEGRQSNRRVELVKL